VEGYGGGRKLLQQWVLHATLRLQSGYGL
jgi:hypothetical protein